MNLIGQVYSSMSAAAALRVLRSETKRFVLRVHPDVLHHLPISVRETNQRSLQALNSALDEAHARCGEQRRERRSAQSPAAAAPPSMLQRLPFHFGASEPQYVTVGSRYACGRECSDHQAAWYDLILSTVDDLLERARIAPSAPLVALLSERERRARAVAQQAQRFSPQQPRVRPTMTFDEVAAAMAPALEDYDDEVVTEAQEAGQGASAVVARAAHVVRARASAFGDEALASSTRARLHDVLVSHAAELELDAPQWDDVDIVLTTAQHGRRKAKPPRDGAKTVVLPAAASAERMLRVLRRHVERRRARSVRRERRRELVDYLRGEGEEPPYDEQ
jgi:hypothetical protein